MTALAAAIGLFPAAIATGIGSETQQPLARVVVGGMVTAPVLILVVLPALYSLAYRAAERRTPVGPGPTPQPHPQDPAVT
jgi:heavy metal efflux system protein